jgi:hypothetical protein
MISRIGGLFYRVVFRHKLHSYSSVFRVYRRSAVVEMRIVEDGLVGVTEMLGRLEEAGARIVECPATLEEREPSGHLKTVWAGVRHVVLMAKLTVRRMLRRRKSPQ